MLSSSGRHGVAAAVLVAALASLPVRAAEPPVVVALTIDTSGSLRQADLARIQDLARVLLGALPAGSEASVHTFDDESRVVLARTADRDAVVAALGRLQRAGRYTALHDALYDVSRSVAEGPATRRAVVLMTDGRDENSALALEDGLKIAIDGRIPVYTVAVGRADVKSLRRIAKLTGGAYVEGSAGGAATTIADGIRTQEPSPPATEAAPAAPGPPTPAPAPGTGPTPAPTEAGPSSRQLGFWVMGIAAALAAALVGAAWWTARRASAAPACATCGRALPGPFAECRSCRRPEATLVMPVVPAGPARPEPPRGEAPPASKGDEYSPTLVARLDLTEEYLEKTSVMEERPVLAAKRGPVAGQVFELPRETVTSIGRSRANDIVIPDVAISSQHCRVRPEGDGFLLLDLKSTNGTFVNERRIERHPLASGDLIRLGDSTLEFRRELKSLS